MANISLFGTKNFTLDSGTSPLAHRGNHTASDKLTRLAERYLKSKRK